MAYYQQGVRCLAEWTLYSLLWLRLQDGIDKSSWRRRKGSTVKDKFHTYAKVLGRHRIGAGS